MPSNEVGTVATARQRAQDRRPTPSPGSPGSMLLIYRHVAWFVLWTLSNVAAPSRFDRHPSGLLNLIVLLEAIVCPPS